MMRNLKHLSLFAAILSLPLFCGTAYSFSFDFDDFDFGDDDDFPGWIEGPGQPLPKYSYYPQMKSFDLSRMVHFRQRQMNQLGTAMSKIGAQLSGRDNFDRAYAIKLAKYIEDNSGDSMLYYYHPGAVMDDQSRTTRSLWGNEELFKADAEKMRQAANTLAEELKKEPGKEEGAVFLAAEPKRGDKERKTVAVSPQLKNKYDALSNTCHNCHRKFRSLYDR